MTTVSYPVRGSDEVYWVYETDSLGYELPERQSGEREFVSNKLLALIADKEKPVTDVVIAVHGWNTKQDDNESLHIFDNLFAGVLKDYNDYPPESPPNFLLIGVHWPSAIGAGRADELVRDDASFEENMRRMDKLCNSLLRTDPPAASRMRGLLDKLSAAADGAVDVYDSVLQRRVDRVRHRLVAPQDPDSDDDDDEALNAEAEQRKELKIVPDKEHGLFKFTSFVVSNVLRKVENIVFGQFLDRSENVGANGLHNLLALLQEYAPTTTRFHLISHSLGAPAVCRALVGPEEKPNLLRQKVHSATFLQAALGSHQFGAGYKFEQLTRTLLPVAGSIIVTTSQSDGALDFYRFFHDYPLGHHGAVDVEPMKATVLEVQDVPCSYKFLSGELYNMIADKFIDKTDDMFAGSHGDIFGPQIMRMIRHSMDVDVKTHQYALPTKLSVEYFKERLQIEIKTEAVVPKDEVSRQAEDGKNDEGKDKGGKWGFCVLS